MTKKSYKTSAVLDRNAEFANFYGAEFGAEVASWIEQHIPTTRVRRGKVVAIPPEWRGEVTRPQTIRKRQAKQTRKSRMLKARYGVWGKKNGHPRTWAPRHTPADVREALGDDR